MARRRTTEHPPPVSSSSEEEDESGKVGSDSDYGSDKSPIDSAFTIKPNKSASESSSKRKRPSSSVSSGGACAVKSPVIIRRWSEAEDITILKGLIEYRSREGADSVKDSGSGFLDFIKKRFQTDVSKTQLYEKTRRLKNKYKANAEKVQNGNDPDLLNPHDHKCFRLSKKIWGNETNEESNHTRKKTKDLRSAYDEKPQKETKSWGIKEEEDEEKPQKETKSWGIKEEEKDEEKPQKETKSRGIKEEETEKKTKALSIEDGGKTEVDGGETLGLSFSSSDSEEENVDFWEEYPCLKQFFGTGFINSVVFSVLENAEAIGREKLKEMEREARQLKVQELELFLERSEMAKEFAEAALASIKGTGI